MNNKIKRVNIEWENLTKNKTTIEDLDLLAKEIKNLEEDKSPYHLEKIVEILKNENFCKDQEVCDIIWEKVKLESENVNKESLNWWNRFFVESGQDPEIRKVFYKIEKADKTGERKDIEIAKKAIKSLNSNYKQEKESFEKRIAILEKRIDRKVSDNFGSLLASIRKQRGLSLAKLGDLAGVSASYINRIELNQRQAPSYPIIEKLANALDVNINTLLVAAGANIDSFETKSLRELMFSNSISFEENEESLSLGKKERLINLIDYIEYMEWKENKHIETIELLNLVSAYKDEEK